MGARADTLNALSERMYTPYSFLLRVLEKRERKEEEEQNGYFYGRCS